MTEIIRITEETFPCFLPLLPKDQEKLLRGNPGAFAIGAVDNGVACAVMTCITGGQDVGIQYIVVDDSYRRQGIASRMVRFLCQYAYPEDVSVYADFLCADPAWDSLYTFFEDLGNFSIDEMMGYRCYADPDVLQALVNKIPSKENGLHLQTIDSLSPIHKKGFFNNLVQEGKMYVDPTDPLLIDALCLCHVNPKTNQVSAAIYVGYDNETKDELKLYYAWCDQGSEVAMLLLLRSAFDKLTDLELEDRRLYIEPINEASEKLVEQILPDRVITQRFYRAIWDMKL